MTKPNANSSTSTSTNANASARSEDTRTFVVAHDLSSFAEEAADTALADLLDSRRGGRIVLVNVVEVFIPPGAFDFSGVATSYASVEQEASVSAARSMERVAERLRAREKLLCSGPPPIEPLIEIESVVRLGIAAEGVIEEAKARNAGRIYVGTHGRSGLRRMVLGSVAERIARLAEVPVVVVHGTRADAKNLERAA